MPANSRIIPEEVSGMLLVTDTAPNLKKLYELIKDLDRKPSAELKKHWDEMAKIRAKILRCRRTIRRPKRPSLPKAAPKRA